MKIVNPAPGFKPFSHKWPVDPLLKGTIKSTAPGAKCLYVGRVFGRHKKGVRLGQGF